MRVVNMSRN